MPHKCPVDHCQRLVPDHMLMCGPHWCRVPYPLRKDVWREWQDGEGYGSEDHAAACKAAVDHVNGLPTR